MIPGIGLTAGGGLSLGVSATSRAEAGPISVGGLTFAPAGKSNQWLMLAGIVGAAVLVWALVKGRR